MAAAALPAAMTAAKVGGTALAGHLLAKKFGKPPALTPQGQQAQTGLQGISSELRGAGAGMLGVGGDLRAGGQREIGRGGADLDVAGGYLRSLVGGGAGAATAAAAPQVANITAAYRGARAGLQRSSLQGANRDLAEAELGRERAGAISGVILNQRPQAVQQLMQLGQGRQQVGLGQIGAGNQASGIGVGALGGSAGPLGTIYQGEQRRAEQGAENSAAIGRLFANLIFDMVRGGGNGGSGGGASIMPGSLWSTYAPSLSPNRP